MITRSNQSWMVGDTVKVGFMAGLLVAGVELTPGDYAPDAYLLTRGGASYSFVPHNGITKLDQSSAAAMRDRCVVKVPA